MTRLIRKISNESQKKHNQRRFFWFLVCAVFVIGACYLSLAGSTIIQIVNKNSKEKSLQTLTLEYQQLEKNYFKLINDVDLNYALSLGFEEQKKMEFAVRQTTVAKR